MYYFVVKECEDFFIFLADTATEAVVKAQELGLAQARIVKKCFFAEEAELLIEALYDCPRHIDLVEMPF